MLFLLLKTHMEFGFSDILLKIVRYNSNQWDLYKKSEKEKSEKRRLWCISCSQRIEGSTMLTQLWCALSWYQWSLISLNQWLPRHKWTCGGGDCHHVILQTSSYEEIHPVFWRKINFDNYINISCPLFFYFFYVHIILNSKPFGSCLGCRQDAGVMQ